MAGVSDRLGSTVKYVLPFLFTFYKELAVADFISPLDHHYKEFGNDIRSLGDNLNNIHRVVENATTAWAQSHRGTSRAKHWNLSSLEEIIGDYHSTLEDCKQLLHENREFRMPRNIAYNFEWTLIIQPKVDHLRKRLDAHNSKIAILLKPLELSLLSEIHHDLAARIDAVHQSVLHLHGLLIPDVAQAISDQDVEAGTMIPIPSDVEIRFHAAADATKLDHSRSPSFPLQAGADALVAHLDQSTKCFSPGRFLNQRSPSAKQYLSLLKCVWIVERLEKSDALRSIDQDSQWPGYIAQLKEEVLNQCERFNVQESERLLIPDLSNLTAADDYSIWVEESIETLISPHVQEQLEEVLKIPLPSPRGTERHITVCKIDTTRYRLVEAITQSDSQVRTSRSPKFSMEVDLRSLNLTPIYATPSSRPRAFELLIHSGSTQINPTFSEAKYLYQLQHLLTGYKVYERYDQAMVTVQLVLSGQTKPLEEHGRIQLWLPKPFQTSSATTSPSVSETQIMVHQNEALVDTGLDPRHSRRNSRNSIPSVSETQVMAHQNEVLLDTGLNPRHSRLNSRNSIPSRRSIPNEFLSSPMSPTSSSNYSSFSAPSRSSANPTPSPSSIYSSFKSSIYSKNRSTSIMSSATSVSKRSTSSVLTINTGKGKARLHEKPPKPLLVIFLKSKVSNCLIRLRNV